MERWREREWVNSENMRILLPIQCCQFLLLALLDWHSVCHCCCCYCRRLLFHSFSYFVWLTTVILSSAIPFPYIHFCSVYLFFYYFSNTLFAHFLLLLPRFVHPSSFFTKKLPFCVSAPIFAKLWLARTSKQTITMKEGTTTTAKFSLQKF